MKNWLTYPIISSLIFFCACPALTPSMVPGEYSAKGGSSNDENSSGSSNKDTPSDEDLLPLPSFPSDPVSTGSSGKMGEKLGEKSSGSLSPDSTGSSGSLGPIPSTPISTSPSGSGSAESGSPLPSPVAGPKDGTKTGLPCPDCIAADTMAPKSDHDHAEDPDGDDGDDSGDDTDDDKIIPSTGGVIFVPKKPGNIWESDDKLKSLIQFQNTNRLKEKTP